MQFTQNWISIIHRTMKRIFSFQLYPLNIERNSKLHENWYKKKKNFIKFHNPMEIEIEFEIDREIRKGKRDLAENSINNFHLCILKIVRFNLSFSLLRQYFYNFWNVRKDRRSIDWKHSRKQRATVVYCLRAKAAV